MNVLAVVKPSDVLILTGILVGVIVAAGAAVLWFRHRYLGGAAREESAGFDLSALERLRASGEISDQEFRRLRRLALGLPDTGPSAEPDDPPSPAAAPEPLGAEGGSASWERADPPEKPSGSLTPDGEDDDA